MDPKMAYRSKQEWAFFNKVYTYGILYPPCWTLLISNNFITETYGPKRFNKDTFGSVKESCLLTKFTGMVKGQASIALKLSVRNAKAYVHGFHNAPN